MILEIARYSLVLIHLSIFLYALGLSLYFDHGLTETVSENQENLIDEDPTRYRKLVEAYVNETMRPLNPLSIRDGELTYVKQVSYFYSVFAISKQIIKLFVW